MHIHASLEGNRTLPELPASIRASDDLKKHMVVADSMEQFQKDLDQGKVRDPMQR